MQFNKKAFTNKDKATLLRAFLKKHNLEKYPKIGEPKEEDLIDLWSMVTSQAKKQWKSGPSSMNSKEWTEEIESRLSYFLQGWNISTTINMNVDVVDDVVQYDFKANDDILGRSIKNVHNNEDPHLGDVAAVLIRFMGSRVKDMQKNNKFIKRYIRNQSELGGGENADGEETGVNVENMAEEEATGMGGRTTGHKFHLRNWYDYDKYASDVQQIGEAVEQISNIFTELVQSDLEPKIIDITHSSSSGNSREEERFMFYAGFGLDVFVQNASHPLGKERVNPPFRKPTVYDISYYLICRALYSSGMSLDQFKQLPTGKKGVMENHKHYTQYNDAIRMAFDRKGSGKPYDQTLNKSGKTTSTVAAKVIQNNAFDTTKDLLAVRQFVTKKIGPQGAFEKTAYTLSDFHIEMDESKSYEEWMPSEFRENFPKYAKRLVKAFEKLDIGLTILASKKTASAVRVANAYMDKYKNNRLIQRVAYRWIQGQVKKSLDT